MEHYAGIDVSLEQSSVCVVDATGRIVRETKVASEPEALARFFGQLGLAVTRIGLEAGPLSQWLIWGIACQAELRFVSSPASFGIVGDRLAPTALRRSDPTRLAQARLGKAAASVQGFRDRDLIPRQSPFLTTRPPGRVNSYAVGSVIRTMIPHAARVGAPRGRIHLHGGIR